MTASRLSDFQPPALTADQHDELKDRVESAIAAALAPFLAELRELVAAIKPQQPDEPPPSDS
jgi:hypothetical protein